MKVNSRISGKTIVITGASSGLGKEIAIESARNGANLFILARRNDRLKALAEELEEAYKVNCMAISLDVAKETDIQRVFQYIYSKVGTIDILVNNAGYGIFAKAEDMDDEEIKRMFDINVLGVMSCTRRVIPYMKSNQSGHIINIASQAGKLATPKSSVYAATKHAVLGYTNSLRMELVSFGIYVTSINPGPIRTSFFEQADPNGNYLDQLGSNVLQPDYVAQKVVNIMCTPKREVNLPWWMNTAATLHMLFPRIVERVGQKAFHKK